MATPPAVALLIALVPDFRFPQDEGADAMIEVASRSSDHIGWAPGFVDDTSFSLNKSTAFSTIERFASRAGSGRAAVNRR